MNRISKLIGALVVALLAALVFHPSLVPWLVTGAGLAVAGTAFTDSDIVRQLAAWGVTDACGGILRRIVIKTADYTILSPVTTAGDASGTIFTNRGATGTVVFTLPAPTMALKGCVYEFLGIADYRIDVKTATADTLIVVNDIAADYLSMQTAGHLIGATMRVLCDGTSWCAYGQSVGDTFTVST